jgi:simple sugar transport system permease protein
MSATTESGPAAGPAAPAPGSAVHGGLAARTRRWRSPVVLWAIALLSLVGFAASVSSDERSGFSLSETGAAIPLPAVDVPSRGAILVLGVLALGVAGYATWRAVRGARVGGAWLAVFGVLVVAAFLVWAVSGNTISLINLLRGSVFLAVPLAFGAMSGVLCERAGVINIAIEGQLLAGAFASAVTASLTGSITAGLLAAVVAGVLVALLLAVFSIRFVVDQIVLGVVLNVLVVGVTSFLYGQLLIRDQDVWNTPDRLQRLRIPVLADVPVLGPVLFDQTIIVYAMYLTVAALAFLLFRTRWGLRVRAVGEHPKAADTAGIDVNGLRFRNVLYGGAVAGFGGSFYTLGAVGAFGEEMTAGQGFIALAALIFGRWTPVGALLAALLFGFATNLQSVLSIIATPIPGEFLLMAPYLATIFAVAGLVGKVRAPAADGVPYRP